MLPEKYVVGDFQFCKNCQLLRSVMDSCSLVSEDKMNDPHYKCL